MAGARGEPCADATGCRHDASAGERRAGGAGAVLANRLSENPGTSVLLVERGGRALNPLLYIPKGFFFTLRSSKLTTTHFAEYWRRIGSVRAEEGSRIDDMLQFSILGESVMNAHMLDALGDEAEARSLAAADRSRS